MSEADIKWIHNVKAREDLSHKTPIGFLSREMIKAVRNFHQRLPEYAVTPLHHLDHLAKELGIRKLWVKDESYRFGLNSFKALGGVYAIAQYLCHRLGMNIEEITFEDLHANRLKAKLGDITLVTATDGNHGRGVAWVAKKLGCKAVVYMPKGSAAARLESIRKEGAEAGITKLNYDDTVRLAKENAQRHGWIIVQDTAWEGYAQIPTWIMQGYPTIMDEVLEQLQQEGIAKPSHIILQAGVGSFSAAQLGYLTSLFGNERPVTAIVEPDQAACIYQSSQIDNGKAHAVGGELNTIMAGLACGEPNPIAWNILRDYADMFIACPDRVAARGMRILANPLGDDPRIISGESGAVGLGLLSLILKNKTYQKMVAQLKINGDSEILVISTEGDTDPAGYRHVVWDGAYPCRSKER